MWWLSIWIWKRGESAPFLNLGHSLTPVSLFDIMWHPLMLLEIENGQFLIWNQAKKMLLSSQEKNTTTFDMQYVKVPQIIFVEEKRSMEITNNKIFSLLQKCDEKKVNKQWMDVLYLKKAGYVRSPLWKKSKTCDWDPLPHLISSQPTQLLLTWLTWLKCLFLLPLSRHGMDLEKSLKSVSMQCSSLTWDGPWKSVSV